MSDCKFKKFTPKTNTIFRGDNLEILRAMADECVDLVYIDPPFFTQRDYKNIWGDKEAVLDFDESKRDGFRDTKSFFEQHIQSGEKGLDAYLLWMRLRIQELHRVLKSTGTIYVHLDYHAAHYAKVILDEVFGYKKFVNEIIWQRKTSCTHAQHKPTRFQNNHDTILVYSKGTEYTFNPIYKPYEDSYINQFNLTDENGDRYMSVNLTSPTYRANLVYTYKGYRPTDKGWSVSLEKMKELDREGRLIFPKDKEGRIRRKSYLKDMKGFPVSNIWDDIGPIQGQSKEKLPWPTQKPTALLERIITASSNEGDIVLDCFAGCGTSMHAAHILKRKWIGLDISPTAIKVNKKRLEELGAKVEVVDENDLEVRLGTPRSKSKAKAG